MFAIAAEDLAAVLLQVRIAFPREACGLLVGTVIRERVRLSVAATGSERNSVTSFHIPDAAIASARMALRVGSTLRGVFHSHILGPARPSRRDIAGPKAMGELWLIYSVRFRDLALYQWDGERFDRKRLRTLVSGSGGTGLVRRGSTVGDRQP
ncbi:MAG: Mov34/MPN/PAD-1 family protein [Caulobacter sp.]|nr:Mov34/MPN/PAD-1 family protein [Caulobacter sp.]